jgi:hypothetical protein
MTPITALGLTQATRQIGANQHLGNRTNHGKTAAERGDSMKLFSNVLPVTQHH